MVTDIDIGERSYVNGGRQSAEDNAKEGTGECQSPPQQTSHRPGHSDLDTPYETICRAY